MTFPGHRLTVLSLAALSMSARATDIETGNPDLQVRWDNTIKYSLSGRLKSQDSNIVNGFPNNNDGDQNFHRGLVSNRFDLYSEADVAFREKFGARISGAAWYDTVYQRSTDNNSPVFPNRLQPWKFSPDTQSLMGRKAELLDYFVYSNFHLGDTPVSARLGSHSLLWGESLFFGSNGIAGLQAPVDTIKLSSVPNSLFKETVRPTRKLSGTLQITSDISLASYLGFEWQPTRLLPAGSYLSTNDFIGPGGENVLGNGTLIPHGSDVKPSNTGQGGLALRWRVGETDLGAYLLRSHATTPSTALIRVGPGANYSRYYQEGIRTVGFSFAMALNEWSISGETSYRMNSPQAFKTPTIAPATAVFDNRSNTPYPVGESVHAQFGWVRSIGPTFISPESSFLGEVAWNARTRFTRGEQYADPNASRSAYAIRMVYAATYRQVWSGVDLTPSIGGGGTHGTSSAVGSPFGADKSGDVNVGISAVLRDRWTGSMSYVHYVGPDRLQLQKDRDYITASVRTNF